MTEDWIGTLKTKPKTTVKPKTRFNTRTLKEVLDMDLPPITDMVKDLFQDSAIILITGTPGSFKTGLVTFFALCAAQKDEMLGMPISRKMRTLFIDEENGFRRIKHKLKRIAEALSILDGDIVFASMSGFKINEDWVNNQLIPYIKYYKPDVIIMDSLIRVLAGSERDEEFVSKIHYLLKPIVDTYSLSIIILHHLRKQDVGYGKGPRTLDDIRGSSDLGGLCDQAFLIEYVKSEGDDTKIFRVKSLKEKDKMNARGFNFKVVGKGDGPLKVLFAGWVDENIDEYILKVKVEILDFFKATGAGPHKTKEIVAALKESKMGKEVVYKALTALVKEGTLDGSKYGSYSISGGK